MGQPQISEEGAPRSRREAKRNRRRGRPRRRGRTTREGKVFNFVTLGVGIAAVNTGNNLLYLMLGLMLSLLLLSMALSELTLRSIRIRRRLPLRAFAEAACLVEIGLANQKRWMPSYSLEIEDAASEPVDRRCYFLKVGAGDEQTAAYRRVPRKRGVLTLETFRVTTRYPFGLIEKTHIYQAPGELLVFPELVQVDASSLALGTEGAESPAGRVGPGTEVAGLRAYRSGDEARSIHWRRTASLGRLVIRERERDAASRLSLVLDNARPDDASPAWDEGFELAVRRAASLSAAALSRGAAVDVVCRGSSSPVVLPGAPPDPIWRYLALLTTVPGSGAPPLAQAAGSVTRIEVRPTETNATETNATGANATETNATETNATGANAEGAA